MFNFWHQFVIHIQDKQNCSPWLWYLSFPVRMNERMRQRFFDGPEVLNYPGRKMLGYKSPNHIMSLWLHAWTMTYLTIPGRILIMVSFALFIEGITTLLMPIYFVSFALISFYVIDFTIGWFFKPNLSIERSLPDLACAGQEFNVTYKIKNNKQIPSWELMIDIISQSYINVKDG
jgi:hypothetical protein